jgi:hypothetical protein
MFFFINPGGIFKFYEFCIIKWDCAVFFLLLQPLISYSSYNLTFNLTR